MSNQASAVGTFIIEEPLAQRVTRRTGQMKWEPLLRFAKENPGQWVRVADFNGHGSVYSLRHRWKTRGFEVCGARLDNGAIRAWVRWQG